jgi:lysophospholipid acyltransferase (LPLAT)-like uncharacterized protein
MNYRVDNIPWPIRPAYRAAMRVVGLLIYLYYLLCRITSKVSMERRGSHGLDHHAIFCLWHGNLWSYFTVFRNASAHAMMSHPAAYMEPIHALLRFMGLKKLLLGSSGEEGREALNQLARLVKSGWSTTISPDGPAGPARILKKGVLHLALHSGAPIVPLSICPARFISWPSWDSRKLPLPFNRIKVVLHDAIFVSRQNFNEAGVRIASVLGGPREIRQEPGQAGSS